MSKKKNQTHSQKHFDADKPSTSKISKLWFKQYLYLVEYMQTHDEMPKSRVAFPEKNKLGHWCDTQRQYYKKKKLSKEKINLLNQLNFCWDINEKIWQEKLKAVEMFVQKNKRFPKTHEEYPKGNKIGVWCDSQRQLRKKDQLQQERIKILNKIKFVWDPSDNDWHDQLKFSKEFYKTNGYFPKKNDRYPAENKLGYWCDTQRKMYKKSTLSEERIQKLAAINFNFDPLVENWNKQYSFLESFYKTYNRLPKTNEEFPKKNFLGHWCRTQKLRQSKGLLSKEEKKNLKKLGLVD